MLSNLIKCTGEGPHHSGIALGAPPHMAPLAAGGVGQVTSLGASCFALCHSSTHFQHTSISGC